MTQQLLQNGQHTGRRSQFSRLLRAANSNIRTTVGLKPGPFDASALKDSGADARSTLITGLLVIYPLVASAAIVLAGFLLLTPQGPA